MLSFSCSTCGRACYCSRSCREEHVPVHQYECPGYMKHLWYLIGIAHLGVRSFLDGFVGSMQKISNIVDCTPDILFNKMLEISEAQRESYQYGKVFRLVTNFDKMSLSDVIQYSLVCS